MIYFDCIIERLEHFLEAEAWSGWDPYDGLNSRFLKALTFTRKWLRISVIQFMKRSPINFRTFLGIAKARNPKAMGLLATAYLLRYKGTKKTSYLDKVREILDWLIANSSPGYNGYSWGYNFDWQSSIFYIPTGVPTVVNTSFIANAFLDAYEVLKDKNYLNIARSCCDFILTDLNRTSLSEVTNYRSLFCFSYSPLDKRSVHNANLLGAELLARVYHFTKEEKLREAAFKSASFTLLHQNPDGSWYYGIGQREKYIDSFHTGFVLVSLKNIAKEIKVTNDNESRRIILKGYEYYKKTFWDEDGSPRYYNNKKYPIDLHCSAQGMITFLKFHDYDPKAVKMARKIAAWAVENMWDDKKGYFYFQKFKYLTIKIPYLRWPNVWMFYALSMLSAEC